jgi:adenylate kinase
MSFVNELTLLIAGPQGSGKDTQVVLLKEYLAKNDPARKVIHFDAGAALRAYATGEGPIPQRVNNILLAGELVPGFITSQVATEFLMGELTGEAHLMISGFPREMAQTLILDQLLHFYKRTPTVLYINISDEVSLERALLRGRPDDTTESIKKRLAWTKEKVGQVMNWYREHPDHYTFIDINGEQTREEVQKEILEKLNLPAHS